MTTAATPTPPAVQPVRVDFADHAERLRLAVELAREQARALQAGWRLDADLELPADLEAAAALDRLVHDLTGAQLDAANVERLVRAAIAATGEEPTGA